MASVNGIFITSVLLGADEYYKVEKFAKENRCIAVEQWGRAGWTKILPKKIPGFKTVYHVMRKDINQEFP